jgi:hypothetical protein
MTADDLVVDGFSKGHILYSFGDKAMRSLLAFCAFAVLVLCGCGDSGGGDGSGSGGGGTPPTPTYTWSETEALVITPEDPIDTDAIRATMRIKCVSNTTLTSAVRLVIALDGVTLLDAPVTMTLLTPATPAFPYNVYVYQVDEDLGTLPPGVDQDLSVTIDANNVYGMPTAFSIKVFTLTITVAPSAII